MNVDGAANRRQMFRGEVRDNYSKYNMSHSEIEAYEEDCLAK